LFDFNSIWLRLLGFSALISIFIGTISGIYQKQLKRLFAYSTIAHTGFILLTFLCCSLDSSKSFVFYVIIYSCLTITTFSILLHSNTNDLDESREQHKKVNKMKPVWAIVEYANSLFNCFW
jgi:NADH-quinone oxidoreductase subunit N